VEGCVSNDVSTGGGISMYAAIDQHTVTHLNLFLPAKYNVYINTLRTGSFKLLKTPFPVFLTILTL